MLSHCSEIRFSGRLNSNLNLFYPTDSYTSNQIDIKWITKSSNSRRLLQRSDLSSEVPEMTTKSESCHASTKIFSHRKNLAIIRIIQGIGHVYT